MRKVVVGTIRGSYGVRGWVRVQSYTDPRRNILNYQPWYLVGHDLQQEHRLLAGREQGDKIVALLEGITDPERARELRGVDILVDRGAFPEPAEGEFYWIDLIGLRVRNLVGIDLGVVRDLMATGANDVLIVSGDRERLIPFIQGSTVLRVDQDVGEIVVDWDAEF